MDAEHVERLLAAARGAREAGDSDAVLARSREAWSAAGALDEAHPLRQVTAWRLAKAEYDLGEPRRMLAALEPILDQDDPFAHYPAGRDGARRLVRRYWDDVGYDAPPILRLWDAYSRAAERAGDPYLAAAGQVQKAWQLACTGDREELVDLLDRFGALTPDTFGHGPHRHTRAPDAPTSIFWVQLDLTRAVLWSAIWQRDERLAREALQVQDDAADDAGVDRASHLWDLDPAVRAALTFEWPVPDGWIDAWQRELSRSGEPRREIHRAIAAGVLAREAGRSEEAQGHFVSAADLAERSAAGPEWVADGLAEALRTPGLTSALRDALTRRLSALVERTSVRAFVGAVTERSDQAG